MSERRPSIEYSQSRGNVPVKEKGPAMNTEMKDANDFSLSRRIIHWVVCIAIMFLSSGCSTLLFKNYGRITPDGDAREAFEKYQVNPKYNYYISGSDVYPNAIIGLDKAYTLEPVLWKPVEMTPEKMRELVEAMQHKVKSITWRLILYGFAVYDDKGKQIGIWYSLPDAKTSVQMIDDHTVRVVTPDIDTYLRHGG